MKLLVENLKSVPLHLLYLELGQIPAIYLVKGNMAMYLHYLLQQKTGWMLLTFLSAQQKEPKRGDWFSYTQKVINEFNLNLSLSDIKFMKRLSLKVLVLVKQSAKTKAFEDLRVKQAAGSKGRNIRYYQLEISDYLMPNSIFYLKDQIDLFEIRCKMNPWPSNRGGLNHCETLCGSILNNEPIFECSILNEGERTYHNHILNGNVEEKIQALKVWRRK